jgi:hypothetical protein
MRRGAENGAGRQRGEELDKRRGGNGRAQQREGKKGGREGREEKEKRERQPGPDDVVFVLCRCVVRLSLFGVRPDGLKGASAEGGGAASGLDNPTARLGNHTITPTANNRGW